jgi:phosphatidate cytidylyltransferase
MKNFWQRTLTGILFVIVIAGGIFYHPLSFFAIFFMVVIGGIYEITNLLAKADIQVPFFTTLLLSVFLFVASFLVKTEISNSAIFYIAIPLAALLFIKELFNTKDNPIVKIASSLFSVCYIAIPFALLSALAFHNGTYNYRLPLSLFILVWINDTGAYLTGVTMGKTKFFERISPKKTWEGTLGGLTLTLITSYILSLIWIDLTTVQWIIFGAIVSSMAVLGDLVESMFKRSIGVKDSGEIFPGHGGILDRFDAVIFALPMAVFFMEIFVR